MSLPAFCPRRQFGRENSEDSNGLSTWKEEEGPSHAEESEIGEQLTSLKRKLSAVLQMGWWSGVRADARREIQDALRLVETMRETASDVHLKDSRESEPWVKSPPSLSPPSSRRSSVNSRPAHGSLTARTSPLFSLMDEGLQDSQRGGLPKSDSLKWLVQTFTAADIDAAEGNEAGADKKVRLQAKDNDGGSSRKIRRMSSSTGDINEENPVSHVDSVGLEGDSKPRPQAPSPATILQHPKVGRLFEKAETLDFDALEFAESPHVQGRALEVLGIHMTRDHLISKLASQGKVPEAVSGKFKTRLVQFLAAMDGLYQADLPYHNACHAADVLMTMEFFLRSEFMRSQVSTLDCLIGKIAAAIHDVGHPGRNNLFQSKTMSAIAVTYNDKSALENLHVAKSFQVMMENSKTNWFELLPRGRGGQDNSQEVAHDLQQYVRRCLIDMVLGTDMAKHADHVNRMELYAQEIAVDPSAFGDGAAHDDNPHRNLDKQEALEKKLLLLECVLHAADISNPCKPHDIMMRWTARVLEEFWAQGDEERSLGMSVSPLCDRQTGKLSVPKGQIGFINFVIRPFYVPIATLIPEVEQALRQLSSNVEFWQEMDTEQVPFESLFGSARTLDAVLATVKRRGTTGAQG